MTGAPAATPPLVYLMGPSGAGKDTLLRYARRRIDGDGIVFAHRYITREPVAGDENFVALTPTEFAARQAQGLFAMTWQARGVAYAIGAEIRLWRAAGCVVVVSGSREHFVREARDEPGILPVLVVARPELIAARLEARGREDSSSIAARLARLDAIAVEHPRLVTLDNSDATEAAGEALVALLRDVRRENGRGP